MLQQASSVVYLIGSLPASAEPSSGAPLLRDWLGTYDRQPDNVNGRPTYVQRDFAHPKRVLWHSGDDWIVGPDWDVPKRRGWMNVRDAAILPEKIRKEWAVGDGRLGWLAAPALRCDASDAARAAAAASTAAYAEELRQAVPTVYLAGEAPGRMWKEWMGAYDWLDRDGQLVNGRHVYVQRGSEGQRMLWYTDGVYWRAGPAEQLGKQRGPLRALDGALLPEHVNAQWEAGDGGPEELWDEEETPGGWLPSPHLRCFGLEGGTTNDTAQIELVRRWEVAADGTTIERHVS